MNTTKRLMIVFHDMKLGGIQKKTIDIVNFVQKYHPEVRLTICLRNKEGIFLKQVPPHVAVIGPSFHTRKLDQVWFTLWIIFQILKISPTHILSFMDLGSIPTLMALKLLFWKKPRITIGEDILTSKYVYTETSPKLRLKLIQFFYPQAQTILVQTPIQQRDLGNILGPKNASKIKVSPNWLPLDFPPPKLTSSPRKLDLLFVGRIDDQKNLPKFIDIVCQLKSYYPRLQAAIVGTGPKLHQIQKLIIDRHLQNCLKLSPPTLTTVSFYLQSKIFLLTSDYEGFPLTLMEAISSGCYPVVHNLPEINRFFDQDASHYLFDDPSQAVKLIRQFLKGNPSKKLPYYQNKLLKLQHRSISQYINYLIA